MSAFGNYDRFGNTAGPNTRSRAMTRRDPWDDARRANERRRNKIERLLKRRERNVMGTISGMGKAGVEEINNEFTGLATGATQDLASRGLSGTTIAPTVQSSISRDKGAALGQLRERLAGLRAGYMNDMMGDRASFLERIEEEYPNYGL